MTTSQRWVMIAVISFVALGVGCGVWLGFFHDWHENDRHVSQEQRANEAVGAKTLPKAPIEIVLKNRPNECRIIDSARLDGGDLWVYYHNGCHEAMQYTTMHWTGFSPDGTVVMSDWVYTHADLDAGQKAEFHSDRINDDPRIVKLEVKCRYNDNP